eukprot:165153-Chlamydomonas_euryale.AAC.1
MHARAAAAGPKPYHPRQGQAAAGVDQPHDHCRPALRPGRPQRQRKIDAAAHAGQAADPGAGEHRRAAGGTGDCGRRAHRACGGRGGRRGADGAQGRGKGT